MTKPTDRFVLKWIKIHLSARITPRLLKWSWLRPWQITLTGSLLGTLAGLLFGLGFGWAAGLFAAAAQVLDGVDGQYARITGLQSRGGAFWDSLLDRYADGAMVIGMTVYLIRLPSAAPPGVLVVLGALALIGSNSISYSTARAETLGLDLGRPTLASKGTRSSSMILCALLSLFWPPAPLASLIHIVLHTNAAVVRRLLKTLP